VISNLIGLSIQDLKDICASLGKPLFHAEQIFNWIYHKGIRDINDMLNLSLDFRNSLKENFIIERPHVSKVQKSVDGTQKWLLSFNDKTEAECVHIPERTRGTLCVSSQIGCTLTCTFCHTGTQTLVRNLTAGEIIGQVMTARDIFSEWPTPQEKAHISNIVMMGMGEPLYNYENVKKAILLMMHQKGIGLSRHKITLSTSGIIPGIKKNS
jgi:23S rRNA (adenine2503-C2)-methyltransferase